MQTTQRPAQLIPSASCGKVHQICTKTCFRPAIRAEMCEVRCVAARVCVISSGWWNILSGSRWQRLTPVWAYRSIPQATTNHWICSLRWHEMCPTHKEKHMQPSHFGSKLFLSAVLCSQQREFSTLLLAYRFCFTHRTEICWPPPSSSLRVWDDVWGWCCWSAWEATVGQLISVWSAIVSQPTWRAGIAPSFVWWLVHLCARQHPIFNL